MNTLLNRRNLLESGTRVFAYCCAFILIAMFASIVVPVTIQGLPSISLEWFTSNPELAGKQGGIMSILLSTLLILSVSLTVSVPAGLFSAIYLADYAPQNRLTNALRLTLDLLASTPSIVIGLFGYVFFSIYLGLGFSILSGGLSLACMILPYIIRYSEDSIRSVQPAIRSNCMALNFRKSQAIVRVILPVAMPGIVTGMILATGRALAETAVLIYTAGYVDRTPDSLLDSGRALSVHIYDLSMNVPGGSGNAYGSAFTLICMILLINGVVIFTGKKLQRA